jgi:hypothetical protein
MTDDSTARERDEDRMRQLRDSLQSNPLRTTPTPGPDRLTQQPDDRDRLYDMEQAMIQAITAYFKADPMGDTITGLRAVEIRAVTDNGDLPSGERMIYRAAETTQDLLILAAPWNNGTGAADAPMVRSQANYPG